MVESQCSLNSKVYLKIDFPEAFEWTTKEISNLGEFVKVYCPKYEKQEINTMTIEFSQIEPIPTPGKRSVHTYTADDNNLTIQLQPDYLFIECKQYLDYSGYIEKITPAIEWLKTLDVEGSPMKDQPVEKIGLRYINNINFNRGNPFEWDKYINKNLISNIQVFDTKTLSRVLSEIHIYDEEYRMKIIYGLFNKEFPNHIVKKEFVLDYDCISTIDLTVNDIFTTINMLHKHIKGEFDKSIVKELERTLKGE